MENVDNAPQAEQKVQINPNQLESRFARRIQTLGYPFQKRYNVDFLEDWVIAYTCGNFLHIKNIQYDDGELLTIPGHQDGVGGFAVHPSRGLIAIGEKGNMPNVYVYGYPDLEEKYVLRGGTEKAYVDLDFDPSGEYLATLGAAPDYLLTVWLWKEERILLRCKAFSQEIWGVRFSKNRTGVLTTYGMGHIRFWTMASTFTGLKLMGDIGKFGREELSDVSAFCELSNGRILSGCESGRILVWDGEFCIFPILREDGSSPHEGMIEHISLNGDQLITTGRDGFVRTWDASNLEYVEVDEGCAHKIEPLQEYKISNKTSIVGLYRGSQTSLVQDAQGVLWTFDVESFDCEEVLECPSGAISNIFLTGEFYEAITVDKGGSAFSWNLGIENGSNPEQNYYRLFSSGISFSEKINNSHILLCFEDGVVRIIERFNNGFGMCGCARIHASAIVCAARSEMLLATAADDGTVFVSTIGEDLDDILPNYFFRVSSPPSSMFWSDDKSKLHCVVGTQILSFPFQNDVDSAESFEVEIKPTEWTFEPPEIRYESDENLAPGQEPEPLAIHAIDAFYYIGDGDFYCTVREGGWDFHLFKCSLSLNRVLETIALPFKHHITKIEIVSDKFLLLGDASGHIQIRTLTSPKRFLLVDVHEAPITALGVTFDSKILISGAEDGTLFSTAIDFDGATESADSCGKAVDENLEINAGDIACEELEDASDGMFDDDEPLETYSFEEAKQRSKDDLDRAKRDHKKKKLVGDMQTLRKKFKRLLQRNSKLDADHSIKREDFDLDPEFRAKHLEKKTEKVEETRKALEPVVRYHEEGVKRLRKRFFDGLECEELTLSALGDSTTVTTFKTSKLSANILEELALFEKERLESLSGESLQQSEHKNRNASRKLKLGKSSRPVSKAAKKDIRIALQAEISEMDRDKPNENEDDPQDIAAIEHAEKTRGDFVLKTSEEYKVPEEKRVDVARKRREIVLLFKKKYDMKMKLNNAILALRDRKKELLSQCDRDIEKLNHIDKQLGREISQKTMAPHKNEYPEKRWDFNHDPAKLVSSDLVHFESKVQDEKSRAEKAERAKLNAYGGDDQSDGELPADVPHSSSLRPISVNSMNCPLEEYLVKMRNVDLTWLQKEQMDEKKKALKYERGEIRRQMNQAIHQFDSELFALRVERANLAIELKSMELEQLRMMGELDILEEFQSKGDKLKARLEESRKAKSKIILDLAKCRHDLEGALTDLKAWEEKDVRLMKEFNACVIGETNPYYPILRKIFLRGKRKAEGEDSDESDFDDFDLSDDSDSDFEEVCPEGCEQMMYNKMLALRERRLDLDEALGIQRAKVDELKAINKNLLGREKSITKSLEETEEEINRFEFDKQSRFNEMDMCLPLHASQFLFDENSETLSLPEDLSNLIVFDSEVLKRLQARTGELIDEQAKLQGQFKDLHKAHRQLKQKYKQVQTNVCFERTRCEQVQLLKFGKLVPLELLDQAMESEEVQAAKSEARKIEKECEVEQDNWEDKLKQLKEEIFKVELENTKKLETLASIEADLSSNRRSKGKGKEMKQKQHQTGGKHHRLVQLASKQARQIKELEEEIQYLKCKGGNLNSGSFEL